MGVRGVGKGGCDRLNIALKDGGGRGVAVKSVRGAGWDRKIYADLHRSRRRRDGCRGAGAKAMCAKVLGVVI